MHNVQTLQSYKSFSYSGTARHRSRDVFTPYCGKKKPEKDKKNYVDNIEVTLGCYNNIN